MRAMPLQRLASAMSARAALSVPSRKARRSAVAARPIPPSHNASVIGFARHDTYASMSCVSASSPVVAVSAGGRSSVSEGSTIANRGRSDGPRRLTFTPCARDAITEFRVTSLPVPAVVGMATQGSAGFSSGRPRPITSR